MVDFARDAFNDEVTVDADLIKYGVVETWKFGHNLCGRRGVSQTHEHPACAGCRVQGAGCK